MDKGDTKRMQLLYDWMSQIQGMGKDQRVDWTTGKPLSKAIQRSDLGRTISEFQQNPALFANYDWGDLPPVEGTNPRQLMTGVYRAQGVGRTARDQLRMAPRPLWDLTTQHHSNISLQGAAPMYQGQTTVQQFQDTTKRIEDTTGSSPGTRKENLIELDTGKANPLDPHKNIAHEGSYSRDAKLTGNLADDLPTINRNIANSVEAGKQSLMRPLLSDAAQAGGFKGNIWNPNMPVTAASAKVIQNQIKAGLEKMGITPNSANVMRALQDPKSYGAGIGFLGLAGMNPESAQAYAKIIKDGPNRANLTQAGTGIAKDVTASTIGALAMRTLGKKVASQGAGAAASRLLPGIGWGLTALTVLDAGNEFTKELTGKDIGQHAESAAQKHLDPLVEKAKPYVGHEAMQNHRESLLSNVGDFFKDTNLGKLGSQLGNVLGL